MRTRNPFKREFEQLQRKAFAAEAKADLWDWLYAHGICIETIEQVINECLWQWITDNEGLTHMEIREFKQLVEHFEDKQRAALGKYC